MTKTAVIYHSGYGHTETVAQSIQKGAATEGDATLIKVAQDGTISDADWAALDAADAIIFGAPTYMGSVSGPFKMFMDATAKVWFNRGWQDKLSGAFTNSHSMSGDKLASLQQLSIFAAQHGMIHVSLGLMPGEGADHQRPVDVLNRVGSFLGVMAQSENEAPATTPPVGDLQTAEHYGKRIASLAKRFN